MGNAILSWRNRVALAATAVTSSSEYVDLPVNNLRNPIGKVRHRTLSGVTNYSINFDFGASFEIGVLALEQPLDAGGINADNEAVGFMTSTDTVRHRLDAVTPGAGVLLDTGVINGGWVPGIGLHFYALSTAVTARYWQIDINASSLAASPGFVDLGRAWAGPAWRPGRNFSFGDTFGFDDPANITRQQRAGIEVVDDTEVLRLQRFTLDMMTEDEAMQEGMDMALFARKQRQVLFIRDPDNAACGNKTAIIGRFQDSGLITAANLDQYQRVYEIRASA